MHVHTSHRHRTQQSRSHLRRRAFSIIEVLGAFLLFVTAVAVISAAVVTSSNSNRDLAVAGNVGQELDALLAQTSTLQYSSLANNTFVPPQRCTGDTGIGTSARSCIIVDGIRYTVRWAVTPGSNLVGGATPDTMVVTATASTDRSDGSWNSYRVIPSPGSDWSADTGAVVVRLVGERSDEIDYAVNNAIHLLAGPDYTTIVGTSFFDSAGTATIEAPASACPDQQPCRVGWRAGVDRGWNLTTRFDPETVVGSNTVTLTAGQTTRTAVKLRFSAQLSVMLQAYSQMANGMQRRNTGTEDRITLGTGDTEVLPVGDTRPEPGSVCVYASFDDSGPRVVPLCNYQDDGAVINASFYQPDFDAANPTAAYDPARLPIPIGYRPITFQQNVTPDSSDDVCRFIPGQRAWSATLNSWVDVGGPDGPASLCANWTWGTPTFIRPFGDSRDGYGLTAVPFTYSTATIGGRAPRPQMRSGTHNQLEMVWSNTTNPDPDNFFYNADGKDTPALGVTAETSGTADANRRATPWTTPRAFNGGGTLGQRRCDVPASCTLHVAHGGANLAAFTTTNQVVPSITTMGGASVTRTSWPFHGTAATSPSTVTMTLDDGAAGNATGINARIVGPSPATTAGTLTCNAAPATIGTNIASNVAPGTARTCVLTGFTSGPTVTYLTIAVWRNGLPGTFADLARSGQVRFERVFFVRSWPVPAAMPLYPLIVGHEAVQDSVVIGALRREPRQLTIGVLLSDNTTVRNSGMMPVPGPTLTLDTSGTSHQFWRPGDMAYLTFLSGWAFPNPFLTNMSGWPMRISASVSPVQMEGGSPVPTWFSGSFSNGVNFQVRTRVTALPAQVALNSGTLDLTQGSTTTVELAVRDAANVPFVGDAVPITAQRRNSAGVWASTPLISVSTCTPGYGPDDAINTDDGRCTVTITADETVPAGEWSLLVTGLAGNQSMGGSNVRLTGMMEPTASFRTSSLSVRQGGSVTVSLPVVDGAGDPLTEETVDVTVTGAGLSVSPSQVVTDGDGIASLTVTASGSADLGFGTLQLNRTGSAARSSVPVMVSGAPATVTVSNSAAGPPGAVTVVPVTVRDSQGAPLPGVAVEAAVSGGDPGVSVSSRITTGADGIARLRVVRLTSGTLPVTVTVDAGPATGTFTIS
jgi:hypothetical protein